MSLPDLGVYRIVNVVTKRWIAASDIGRPLEVASSLPGHRMCSSGRFAEDGERVRTPRACVIKPEYAVYARIRVNHDGANRPKYTFEVAGSKDGNIFPPLPLFISHNSPLPGEGDLTRGTAWRVPGSSQQWWVNEVPNRPGEYTLEVPDEGLFAYTRTDRLSDSCHGDSGSVTTPDEEAKCSCQSPSVGCVVLAKWEEITRVDNPQVYWRFADPSEPIQLTSNSV